MTGPCSLVSLFPVHWNLGGTQKLSEKLMRQMDLSLITSFATFGVGQVIYLSASEFAHL